MRVLWPYHDRPGTGWRGRINITVTGEARGVSNGNTPCLLLGALPKDAAAK